MTDLADSDGQDRGLRSQAERGDPGAQLALGKNLAARHGRDGHLSEARAWHEKVLDNRNATDQQRAEAFLGLGSLSLLDAYHRSGLDSASDDDPSDAVLRCYCDGARLGHIDVLLLLSDPLDYYERAARLGSIEAQFQLGWIHAHAGDPASDEIAVSWFRKVAKQDVRAALALGLMYELGRGVARDGRQAAAWFESALEDGSRLPPLPDLLPIMIEHGFATPYFLKGLMHDYGWTIARDDRKAAHFYRKAFEEHVEEYRGKAPTRAPMIADPRLQSQLTDWYRAAAEAGDSLAQNALGLIHECGWGADPDHAAAIAWYRKAAESGLAQAQTNLGRILYASSRRRPRILGLAPLSTDPDIDEAMVWFRKAAEQGFPEAQYRLGLALRPGQGRDEEDFDEALSWLQKSADQGNADARFELGNLHQSGRRYRRHNFKPDLELAQSWFRKAAEQGHPEARVRATDDVDWLYHAAASGLGMVQYDIGQHYLGSKDTVALFWLLKAAEQSDPRALIDLTVMLSKPSPQSLADKIHAAATDYHKRGLLTAGEADQKIRGLLRGNPPGSNG
jgi:uncharacterized protein